jgi:Zn-dependent peptidase ImmA (M78 family)
MRGELWDRLSEAERAIVEKYLNEVPVRVGALAEELGIRVLKSPLDPRVSGLIQPSDEAPSGFEIKLNKYESPERQRFTLAHEIAHYLLHRAHIGHGVVDNTLYRSNLTSIKEVEANRLAADLIMPKAQVVQEVDRAGQPLDEQLVEELSGVFRVSKPAMRVRLGLT